MHTIPDVPKVLYICMGSACHQAGVMQVLPMLEDIIRKYSLQGKIEVKGAFCLGNCGHGIVLKIDEHLILGVNEKNIKRKFERELLPLIQGEPVE